MAQIFHPLFNPFARASVFGGVMGVGLVVWVIGVLYRSPYVTQAGVVKDQPIPFSHEHHVGGLGIDCRYCHTSVETNSFAGMPPTKTCMNCHAQIWTGSPTLAPVRASYRDDMPIKWDRVHRLAEFVYFDHSIHLAKGVSCVNCHGRVDQMQAVYQKGSLLMEWCLDCHRQPEKHLRPRETLYDFGWQPELPEKKQRELLSAEQVKKFDLPTTQ